MVHVQIRQAREEDLAAVANIWRDCAWTGLAKAIGVRSWPAPLSSRLLPN